VKLIFVLNPPVKALRVEWVNVSHHLHKVSLDALVGLHQVLYAAGVLLLLLVALLLLELGLLQTLLKLLLELVSGQEWDHVIGQRRPQVVLLLFQVAHQLVTLLGEHVEPTVGQVRTDLDCAASTEIVKNFGENTYFLRREFLTLMVPFLASCLFVFITSLCV
jgi:hypothetical protein